MGHQEGEKMAFQLESSRDENLDEDKIFFRDLSDEAQAKALELKGIEDYREEDWDIMPLVYYYEPIYTLSQSEIDDTALAFIRK